MLKTFPNIREREYSHLNHVTSTVFDSLNRIITGGPKILTRESKNDQRIYRWYDPLSGMQSFLTLSLCQFACFSNHSDSIIIGGSVGTLMNISHFLLYL